MMDRWERSHREIHLLPADQRADRVKVLVESMPEEMQTLGILGGNQRKGPKALVAPVAVHEPHVQDTSRRDHRQF